MSDTPALTKSDKKDILVEAVVRCREKELYELLEEVQEVLKERGIRPTVELVESIMDA